MKIVWRRLFVAIALGAVMSVGLVDSVSQELPMCLEFDWTNVYPPFKPIRYAVYYTTAADGELSERQVVRSKGEVKDKGVLEIPTGVTAFRFDAEYAVAIPESAGQFVPPVLRVSGHSVSFSPDWPKVINSRMTIAVYADEITPSSRKKVDVFLLLTVFSVLTILFWFMIGLLAKAIGKSRSGYVVIVFCLLSIIPSMRICQDTVSLREKRRLVPFPSVSSMSFSDFSVWCSRFDAAFTDRFFGRDALISLRNRVHFLLPDNNPTTKAVCGREGWLFLRETLFDFANVKTYTEEEKSVVLRYLLAIARWCESHGKRFLVVVCPDKCRVYPEFVSGFRKFRSDDGSRTEDLVDYLIRQGGLPVLYPRRLLLAEKEKGSPLYYRQDTHWTSFAAYEALCRPLWQVAGISAVPPSWKLEVDKPADLRALVGCCTSADPTLYVTDLSEEGAEVITSHDKLVGQNYVRFKGTTGGEKVLFGLRDSFFIYAMPFVLRSFRSGALRWRPWFEPEDAAEIKVADVVLLEIVERCLPALINAARTFPNPIPPEFE